MSRTRETTWPTISSQGCLRMEGPGRRLPEDGVARIQRLLQVSGGLLLCRREAVAPARTPVERDPVPGCSAGKTKPVVGARRERKENRFGSGPSWSKGPTMPMPVRRLDETGSLFKRRHRLRTEAGTACLQESRSHVPDRVRMRARKKHAHGGRAIGMVTVVRVRILGRQSLTSLGTPLLERADSPVPLAGRQGQLFKVRPRVSLRD